MSLHFDIKVNCQRIGSVEIQRMTNVGVRPADDDVSTYRGLIWWGVQSLVSDVSVEHRYGDGALALVHAVIGEHLSNLSHGGTLPLDEAPS